MHEMTWEMKIEANLEGLVKSCKSMLDRIEKLEQCGSRFIVPAESVAMGTPPSKSNPDNDEPPAAIASNLTEAMRCVSPPLDLTSDLGQKSKSRILEQLWSEIEAAQSKGIGWMSIRDMIRAHIEGHKS
jgi:hypothetical protein